MQNRELPLPDVASESTNSFLARKVKVKAIELSKPAGPPLRDKFQNSL